jgi:hypothetical protein
MSLQVLTLRGRPMLEADWFYIIQLALSWDRAL